MKKIISFLVLLLMFTSQQIFAHADQSDKTQSAIEKNLMHFPEGGLPVLMYHSIGTKYDRSICVSEKLFKEQMEWLNKGVRMKSWTLS